MTKPTKKQKKQKKQSTAALRAEIERLRRALSELNKTYQFKYEKGRPVMVVQIGDPQTGWIGDSGTVAFLIRELKQAGVDELFNVVIYHYAARFQILGGK